MSDSIVRIVSQDPFYKISLLQIEKTKCFLENNISCDFIDIKCSMTPMFIDCGSNFESIACPYCGSKLSFQWWNEVMNNLSKIEFTSIETYLPCCGKMSSLNDLEYYFPCGFACFVIDILNPTEALSDDIIDYIESILKTNINIITKHV